MLVIFNALLLSFDVFYLLLILYSALHLINVCVFNDDILIVLGTLQLHGCVVVACRTS